ncbi:nucleotide-binding protein [Pullulanibacillus camelliae]|uniref:Nucleotide-binding protein n=1 Tax=Pullulanibacillus camelliae TaxID=1707096 RepID=A0A8J2VP05_9BACL|nr:RNase adapter RapZ [Pullulanibacillus camelliae]GGE36559.1 nucleotide-binding protein [Pullulanibacillus camelliae]
MNQKLQIIIITGMSGAGKTVAIQSLEDMGFFCIDNLPPTLLPKFLDMVDEAGDKLNKLALVMDLRGREFFDSLFGAIDSLSNKEHIQPQILFLDSEDEALVRRYKETRRAHPLAPHGTPLEGIQAERKVLEDIKGHAQYYIDTTGLKPKQLKEKMIELFTEEKTSTFNVNVLSFGFKYGIPIDADLVFDVRFLPNPYYIEHMRERTGLEKDVSDYVFKWTETKQFLQKLTDLLIFMLPHYKREGKSQLVIAIGCTGGKHRSVALAEYLGQALKAYSVTNVYHRDIEKGKEKTHDK